MKKYVVEERLLQAVLTYLATQPWAQVNEIIAAIQKLNPMPEKLESVKTDGPAIG